MRQVQSLAVFSSYVKTPFILSIQQSKIPLFWALACPFHYWRNSYISNPMKPKINQIIIVRGIRCRIFKIHPLGTIDVCEIGGSRAFRLSGLPL
jgi:hypothetical protein